MGLQFLFIGKGEETEIICLQNKESITVKIPIEDLSLSVLVQLADEGRRGADCIRQTPSTGAGIPDDRDYSGEVESDLQGRRG